MGQYRGPGETRVSPTTVRFISLYLAHDVDSNGFEALPGESDIRRTSIVPHQNTVFSQVTKHLPWRLIDCLVAEHQADKGVRRLTTKNLLLALLFAQYSDARSLRDLEAILESQDARRYHARLPVVHRSTLADAIASRPLAVFTGVLSALIPSLTRRLRREVGDCVRLIDSTSVRLNRLSEAWSRFSADLCGVKAHVIYDPDADCPLYLAVTPARVNDITAAKAMPIDPGATYVFDLGYYDYGWWRSLDDRGCRIVTRLKANTPLQVTETLSLPANADNIVSDEIGFLPTRLFGYRANPMSDAVREIKVTTDTGKILRILTNDLDAPASEVAALYKRRWAIELFFRWIKQTLKLRHFFGTSDNAVSIQITVALIAFVLIKLAHSTQSAIESLTRFGRLIRANVLHRKSLHNLRPRHQPPEQGRTPDLAQGLLL
jgi:hypothetical protein